MHDIAARKRWILVIVTMFNFNQQFVCYSEQMFHECHDKITMEKKRGEKKIKEKTKCDSAS